MNNIKKIQEFFSKPLEEAKKETGVDMAKKQLDALGVKYEMSKTDKVRPFKVIYKPINKEDDWYDKFEEIVDLFNLKGFVKQSIKENNGIDYTKLINLIKSANNPRNLPIYYNSDNGVVNIGGVGYDKGELVKMFNSQPGQSLDIKNLFYKANQNPEETKSTIESMDPSIKVEMGYGYGNEPFIKYSKSLNEAKSEDKVDTITMDIPLFLRMLEYSREDASQDTDLHDVTEKANRLGKERGILQMDDYEEIVGAAEETNEATDYMKRRKAMDDYYTSKKDKPKKSYNPNPSGKTDYMKRREKDIEENVAPNHTGKAAPYGSGYKPLEERIAKALDQINEELCPAGKAYIKRRQAAGEKSSAYLSGRAVKVCKGQMSGKSKKK
jgi:hypothetical protein